MAEVAGWFFDRRWIDAPPRPGKYGGAFSHGAVPSVHPYILLNYDAKPRDVMTLAHELGHGVHQKLSGVQGVLQADTPLTTAETASVFGEMLVFQSMMAQESSPQVRLGMLTQKIEDSFATAFRQISMNRFENAIHTARREEGELTSERFSSLWMETQRAMFGDSVTLTDDYGAVVELHPALHRHAGLRLRLRIRRAARAGAVCRGTRRSAQGSPTPISRCSPRGGSDWPHAIVAPLGVEPAGPGILARWPAASWRTWWSTPSNWRPRS